MLPTAWLLSLNMRCHLFFYMIVFVVIGMVHSIHGSYKVTYHPDGEEEGEAVEIDFTPPFKRFYMFPTLEEALKVKLPNPTELHTPEATKILDELCEKHGIECSPPRTAARLLDKVSALFFYCTSINRVLSFLAQS
jgi:lysyl-tRNA synthetase class 2